jgi:hypothetical protein
MLELEVPDPERVDTVFAGGGIGKNGKVYAACGAG